MNRSADICHKTPLKGKFNGNFPAFIGGYNPDLMLPLFLFGLGGGAGEFFLRLAFGRVVNLAVARPNVFAGLGEWKFIFL
jgi:uncharacterized membrane protein